MALLKNKIFSYWKQTKKSLFFGILKLKRNKHDQEAIDRKLVYAQSPSKIPNRGQLKHLKKFLNPKEHLIIKLCLLLILVNAVYLSIVFLKKHLQYLPIAGGAYSEGMVGYPKSINPLYAVNRDIDSDLSHLIYSSLFKYDDNGVLVNDLAESLNINGDREYLVKIKNEVKWHNGGQLTVDDILFTFNLIKDEDYRSPLRSALSGVEAEKVDNQTIKFTLSEPYAPFPELLTFGILPKSIWENISPSAVALNDLNLKPIGSGPYKFKSLIKNKDGDLKEYHLEVNNNYYERPPYLKNINFKFFTDYQEMIKAFNDNQLDGLSYLPSANRKDVLAQNSVIFHELLRPQTVAIFFNGSKNKNLANKEIRVALASAIDKDQLINELFDGIYKRADGPIVNSNPAYGAGIKKYEYAPESSAAVFKTKPLALVLSVIDSGNNTAVAEKIKTYWEKAGVKVSLKIISSEQAPEVVKARNFEALIYGQSVGGDPDVYAFWHSTQTDSRGLNLAGYNNPAADKLLAEARVSTDPADRLSKYQKFQEILTNDIPAIFLYSPTYTYLQSKKIKGFSGTMIIEPSDRLSNISGWYLKTKKKLAW